MRENLPPPHWSPTGNSGTWRWIEGYNQGRWKWKDDGQLPEKASQTAKATRKWTLADKFRFLLNV